MGTDHKTGSTRVTATRMIVTLTGLCLGCISVIAIAEPPTPERIEWHKVPIDVELSVGTERLIQFPTAVKLGVPAILKSKLRAQSVSDTLYLRATEAFDPIRVIVQTLDGERTYLLDVAASSGDAALSSITVVDPVLKRPPRLNPDAGDEHVTGLPIDPVTFTRYAAQQLYAPVRLLPTGSGMVREPVNATPVDVDLVRGAQITAAPLIAWRAGSLHLTAVKLTNRDRTPIVLDPRALRGEWLTATFQHNRLLAAGDEADTTVVYLVSLRPFAHAR